ncbi:GNAT family N-acetyltransferase [Janibacter endophyticus]|uniref:GNAT family N-acetyltransferase n=1 Tax=Janibacter endophyticus TaxID=2806261 RepID=UPI0027DB5F19|nr:GNAT family N-acetyltransferase [Janibacter endophyticus]
MSEPTTDRADLLSQYDKVLRPYEMQMPSAHRSERVGPVAIGHYDGGRGFVSCQDLEGLDASDVRALVDEVVDRLVGDPTITSFEWKTRSHDEAPGLIEALTARGFVADEEESVMIGPAEALVQHEPPAGVTVRQVFTEPEVRAAVAAASAVFGSPPQVEQRMADELVRRVLSGEGDLEMWVAEAGGEIVSSGRLEPVPGTPFAGIWGGSTRADWRRRGVYRALTAARARSAMERGVRYLHSDSTEDSRPILERSGFVRVTTTTPYEWHR